MKDILCVTYSILGCTLVISICSISLTPKTFSEFHYSFVNCIRHSHICENMIAVKHACNIILGFFNELQVFMSAHFKVRTLKAAPLNLS